MTILKSPAILSSTPTLSALHSRNKKDGYGARIAYRQVTEHNRDRGEQCTPRREVQNSHKSLRQEFPTKNLEALADKQKRTRKYGVAGASLADRPLSVLQIFIFKPHPRRTISTKTPKTHSTRFAMSHCPLHDSPFVRAF
jgi:hypothetical protein